MIHEAEKEWLNLVWKNKGFVSLFDERVLKFIGGRSGL